MFCDDHDLSPLSPEFDDENSSEGFISGALAPSINPKLLLSASALLEYRGGVTEESRFS